MTNWPSRLRGMRARVTAASPGPWPLPHERRAPTEPYAGRNPNYDERLPLDHEGCGVWPWHREADMVFAYRARDDIPALLDYVEQQQAQIARLRAALATAVARLDDCFGQD